MSSKMEANKLVQNILDRPLVTVIGVSVIVYLVLYYAVVSTTVVSMTLLALIVAALIYMEKKDYVELITERFVLHKKTAMALAVLFIIVFPYFARGSYLIHIGILICLYSTISLGLNFQMGSTDMVNFAPAAFFGVGAYTSAMLSLRLGVSPWLGLVAAALMGIVIGYIVGAPTLKTKGYYLSLVTIAMQQVFFLMLYNTRAVGGPDGLPGIPSFMIGNYSLRGPLMVFGTRIPYQAHYFYLAAVIMLLAAFIATRLYNSRNGLTWNTIAGDDIVATCQGINLSKNKLLAFCFGGAFAAVAGVVYAHYMTYIGPDDFTFLRSLIIISMVILGGMDNVVGVIIGATILTLVDQKMMDITDYRMLAYGLVIIVMLVLRPEGLLPKRIRTYGHLLTINKTSGK